MIMQNNGHFYTVQGHSRSPNLVPIERSNAIMFVNNILLTSCLGPHDIFHVDKSRSSVNVLVRGWIPEFRVTKIGLMELEATLRRMNQSRYLEPFRREARAWRTERWRYILIADATDAWPKVLLYNYNRLCDTALFVIYTTAIVIDTTW